MAGRREVSTTDPQNHNGRDGGVLEEPQLSTHLRMLLLVDKDPIDPEHSVAVQQPCPLCWAPLLNHPDQVTVGVLLNAEEEAIVLPLLFGQFTLSGVEGGGHFCDKNKWINPWAIQEI